MVIERCFWSLKRTQIRMMPMYHRDSRSIEAHMKICLPALLGIDLLAKRLKTSKKRVIKESGRQLEDRAVDVMDETCGAWRRNETPQDTVRGIREEMDRSQTRVSAR